MKFKNHKGDKVDLYKALVDFLPEYQQDYMDTKAYLALCEAVLNYIESDYDTRQEKLHLLANARNAFEFYCMENKAPSKENPHWQQEIERMMQ